MRELGSFSDAATPVFSDLGDAAPSLTRATRALGPFSEAGVGALTSLGDAAEESGPLFADADPVIRQVRGLAKSGEPATKSLSKLLTSFRETNGFQYLMELIYNSAGSVNAFDQFGHFLRALLPLNNCVDYESIAEPSCGAKFDQAITASARARLLREAITAAQRAVLGSTPEPRRDSARSEEAGARTSPPRAPEADAPGDSGSDLGPATEDPDPPDVEPLPEADTPAEPESEGSGGRPPGPPPSMRAGRDLLDFLLGDGRPTARPGR